MKKSICASLLAVSAAFALQTAAAEPVHMNVSYQPTNWWALPYVLATKKNWWADVGLQVSYSTFPAGVPQIASAAAGSWDAGGTGSVPAVIGAARYHILTVGITNDESATNVLIATKEAAARFEKNPKEALKGQRILVTANSTGEYAAAACLHKYGLSENDVTMVNLGQAGIMSALTSGTAGFGALWAPNSYTLEDKIGAKIVCTGKDGDAIIPGALVVREDYAKEHPDLVAKYLAVYLHAIKWEKAHPEETVKALQEADKEAGVPISEKYAKVEYQRPIFDLAEQLEIMARHGGKPSKVDVWFDRIAEFMKSKGSLQSVPAASSYITDKYLKMVNDDPKLKAFANDASR
ncbi:MAG: ABC transporter substrate-binding protein [Betaproteobacteria bacterium]|nr:ABC transporter substrate-binding protein [Betaproteobacteria bacterium]